MQKVWASGDNLADSCKDDPCGALVFALEKFIKANKQLVAVARGINKKGVLESLAQQLTQAQENLSEQTNQLAEDKKAAQATTNKDYVKGLISRTSALSTVSSNLCKLCEQISTDTQQVLLYKSVGLAATTLRDSLLLMVDTLAEVSEEWQDPFSEMSYYGAAKVVEKALTHLLNAKAKALGDNVIPRGEVSEVMAACCASVSSLTKVLYAYDEAEDENGPTPLELYARLRTAATCVFELVAATNNAIQKSDLGISHTQTKESLLQALEAVRSAFSDMLSDCNVLLRAIQPGQASEMERVLERPRDTIAYLLSCMLSLSEVNISEVKNTPCKPLQQDAEAAQKLLQASLPERPWVRTSEEVPKEYLDGGYIWDEGPDSEDNCSVQEGKLKLGTFNKIIEKMTSADATDKDSLLKTFVMTHTSLTTSEAFFDKLMQRFEVPAERAIERTTIQARVVKTLLEWLSRHFDEMSLDLIDQIEGLADSLRGEAALRGSAAKMLQMLQQKRSEREEMLIRSHSVDLNSVSSLGAEAALTHPSKVLVVYSEEDIAKQLTLLDYNIYSRIRVSELLDQAWSKPKYKYRARNILRLISRSNDLTLWICSLIVWPKTLKERIRVLTKIVEIGATLRRLNNFNSLIAVMSAISNSAVHRLKHTFEGLSEECTRVLNELRDATSVDGNRKAYRSALAAVQGPCIPFIGVTLTDITFLDDAQPSITRGMVNVGKFDRLGSLISEVLAFQDRPFDVPVNEVLAGLLSELPHNSEDELFKLSLLREPRGAEKSALL